MKRQYVFSPSEVDKIEESLSKIYSRIEQLESVGKFLDYADMFSIKENVRNALMVLNDEEEASDNV